MPSEARQKKIMEKLNRAQKCSILGPQNLGSGGGGRARAPGPPPGSAPGTLLILQYKIITIVHPTIIAQILLKYVPLNAKR